MSVWKLLTQQSGSLLTALNQNVLFIARFTCLLSTSAIFHQKWLSGLQCWQCMYMYNDKNRRFKTSDIDNAQIIYSLLFVENSRVGNRLQISEKLLEYDLTLKHPMEFMKTLV